MRVSSGARGWAGALAAAILLLGGSASAGWPNASPAQPLAQVKLRCALGITPLNRRCRVIDYAEIGEVEGRQWYYAFYATHWADRHGKMDRGFPIFFYLQKPATLRLGLWVNDAPGLAGQWARTPPPRPILVNRPEATYLGLTLKAVRGQDEQRLFRQNEGRWKNVSVLYRSDEDRALIDGATPKACEAVDEGNYDWIRFRLLIALRTRAGGAPCGVISAGLQVRKDRVYLTDAILESPITPVPPPRRP